MTCTSGNESIDAWEAGDGPSLDWTSRRTDSRSMELSTRVIERVGWCTKTATSRGEELEAEAKRRIHGRRSAVAPRVLSSSRDGGRARGEWVSEDDMITSLFAFGNWDWA